MNADTSAHPPAPQQKALIIPPGGDGFLGELVPNFYLLLEEKLEDSPIGPASENSYRLDLLRFNAWRGDRPISKALIQKYLKAMSEETVELSDGTMGPRYSPASVKRARASLRWYIKIVLDLLSDDEFIRDHVAKERREYLLARATHCLQARAPKGSRGEGIEAGRYVHVEDFNRLMAVCLADPSNAGIRDRAMLSVGWATGVRVSEIAGLRMEHVTLMPGPEYSLRIIGKGNKQRPVPLKLTGNAARHLRDWLNVRGNAPGAVFCRLSPRGGHPLHLHKNLTPRALHMILASRLEETRQVDRSEHRPELADTTWHDFRRTVISDIIAQGDIVLAQKIAGHSSVSMTAKYDRLWQERVPGALASRPDVPY
jgi:site-specific recombinase XerC